MKLIKYILLVALSFVFAVTDINACEAKTLAVFPLLNRVEDRQDYNQMYYSCIFDVLKAANNYSLMDNDKLDALMKENFEPQALPSKEQCRDICRQTKVEVIFALAVEEQTVKERFSQQDSKVDLLLVGKAICYDSATDKYNVLKLRDEEVQDSSLMARYDITGSQFSNNVRRVFKRALNIKKVTIEKPRLGV